MPHRRSLPIRLQLLQLGAALQAQCSWLRAKAKVRWRLIDSCLQDSVLHACVARSRRW